MKCTVGVSSISDPQQAVKEAVTSFQDVSPVLILFFCPVHMFNDVAILLHRMYPEATTAGTTTHYSFTNGDVQENALSVTCIESGIKCAGGIIQEISRYPSKYASEIVRTLQHFPHKSNLACLEFTTAHSLSEELVLDTLSCTCNQYGIPVIGGTAFSADSQVENAVKLSYVALNGQIYTDSTVFLMIQNKNGRIRTYKENIYELTDTSFLATSVDVRKRLVHEFDNKPAVEVLTKALHCTRKELPEKLNIYHLGRQTGNDVQVCSFDKICTDGAVSWHTRIYNNTQVNIVQPINYRQAIKDTITTIKLELPDPSLVFFIQCEGRSLFFKTESFLDEFAKEYKKNFSVSSGISALGEQLGNKHLNYTMLAMVFE